MLVPLLILGFCPRPATAEAAASAVTGAVEKADRLGRAWRAWTEETPSSGSAWLAPAGDGAAGAPLLLERDPATLYSPALDHDIGNNAWAAWIRAGETAAEVRLRDVSAGRTWTVARGDPAAFSQVRLAAAGDGAVWIVWTERTREGVEVRARSLAAGLWSPAVRLSAERPGPCLSLRAAAGPDGGPWVYWSAFDGRDYEIEGARHLAGQWTAAPALTANGVDDILDGLGFEAGRFTASWKRPGPGSRAGVKRAWTATGWGPETPGRDPSPGRESGRSGTTRRESPERARPENREDPGLDDDTFLCLGDSITYGVLNGEYHPELGYIPRLQALMTAAFGAANLVNAGVPGEVTFNGLGRLAGLIAEHRSRYVLIMEGTNDVVFNEIDMAASAFHVEQMIRRSFEARVFPLLATILPRTDFRWERKFYRDRILALNTSLRNIAQNLRVPLVDQFSAFYEYPEGDGSFPALFSDGNHPNESGYDLMSRTWHTEVLRIPFCPVEVSARRVVERSLLASRTLDVVSWPHNPKILDPTPHLSYRVYRRDAALPEEGFRLLASLPFSLFHSPQTHFDFTVEPGRNYAYAVTLVRIDGIEGPPSGAAED